jgi:hypothetical protein
MAGLEFDKSSKKYWFFLASLFGPLGDAGDLILIPVEWTA